MLGPIAETVRALFEKRFTVEFPEQKDTIPDSYRGMPRLDIETCISCSACEKICPSKAITMVEIATEKGTRIMPQVGLDRCLLCGLCEEVCPPRSLTLSKDYEPFSAYDKRDLIKRPEELE